MSATPFLPDAQPSTEVPTEVAVAAGGMEAGDSLGIDDHAQAAAGAAPCKQGAPVQLEGLEADEMSRPSGGFHGKRP